MINVLAIDDEPLALRQLAAYIGKVPFFNLAGECSSALQAKELMEKTQIDAIFCDINMPDLSGMDFVKQLKNRPIVVFTTAYSKYAVEGYKVDALDYLLKPFGLEEFKESADKVKKQYDLIHGQSEASVVDDKDEMTITDSLFVKTEGKMVKINIAEISYIEGMSEYLKIHFASDRRPVIVLFSMKRMEEKLPANFMRVHRSFIVNLDRIKEVNKNRIVLDKDVYLPIGDLYRDNFTKYLNRRFLGK